MPGTVLITLHILACFIGATRPEVGRGDSLLSLRGNRHREVKRLDRDTEFIVAELDPEPDSLDRGCELGTVTLNCLPCKVPGVPSPQGPGASRVPVGEGSGLSKKGFPGPWGMACRRQT